MIKKMCLKLIRWYQRDISPTRPASCRFYPTCSAYTYTAIERFGVFVGVMMGIWRIIRCNPLCKGGYDPVPEKRERKLRRKND